MPQVPIPFAPIPSFPLPHATQSTKSWSPMVPTTDFSNYLPISAAGLLKHFALQHQQVDCLPWEAAFLRAPYPKASDR